MFTSVENGSEASTEASTGWPTGREIGHAVGVRVGFGGGELDPQIRQDPNRSGVFGGFSGGSSLSGQPPPIFLLDLEVRCVLLIFWVDLCKKKRIV